MASLVRNSGRKNLRINSAHDMLHQQSKLLCETTSRFSNIAEGRLTNVMIDKGRWRRKEVAEENQRGDFPPRSERHSSISSLSHD